MKTLPIIALAVLAFSCGEPPTAPQSAVAGSPKVDSDLPGGLLVGTWLRTHYVQLEYATVIDTLVIRPIDGVANELSYWQKSVSLVGEGWSNPCGEVDVDDIDNYVECLTQEYGTDFYGGSHGRIRIQEDNGQGHIQYDLRRDYYVLASDWLSFETFKGQISYNQQAIVWDDRLVISLPIHDEGQYIRSER